jgi:hypothetical protein
MMLRLQIGGLSHARKIPQPPASRAKFIAVVLALITLALLVSVIGPGAVSIFTTEELGLIDP